MSKKRTTDATMFDAGDAAKRQRLKDAGWSRLLCEPERWCCVGCGGLKTLDEAIEWLDKAEAAENP